MVMRFVRSGFLKSYHPVIVTLCLLLVQLSAVAQAPVWQSVVAAGQTAAGSYSVQASAADATGNIFLVGTGAGTISFGSTTFNSTGNNYAYVAKWSPVSRTFVWAMRANGTAASSGTTVAVSGSTVYVGGNFAGSFDFGGATLASAGQNDVFVAKFSDAGSSGSFGWAQRAGGTGTDELSSLAANGTSVYIGGDFLYATASFGTTTLPGSATGAKAFIAKLTDAGGVGSFAWAQSVGGSSNEIVYSLTVSGSSVYVGGAFSGTAAFGAIPVAAAAGVFDAFVAKLADAGTTAGFVWVQRTNGSNYAAAFALAVSGPNVYVAGNFSGANVSFGTILLSNSGGLDLFVAKLTDAGTSAGFVWAQRAGGSDNERVRALALSGAALYAVGSFQSPTVAFGATTLSNADRFTGSGDIFITRLTDAGNTANFDFAQRAGGSQQDEAFALTRSQGITYVGGGIIPTASFGTQTVSTPSGVQIGFLATHSDGTLAVKAAAPITLAVFPNPARTVAQLQLAGFAGPAEASVTLFNSLGQVAQTQQIKISSAGTINIPLQNVAPGTYRVLLQAGKLRAASILFIE